MTLISYFEGITFEHILQEENQLANALATMSSMFKVRWDNEALQITIERLDKSAHCYKVDTDGVEEKPWFHEENSRLKSTPRGRLSMIRSF